MKDAISDQFMSTEKFIYRPEIDGLRAIAVLSVFVFHLNRDWLPGGFVGVDVFFVISGYLITSVILKDYQDGKFSFSRFYQRRIARIFPVFWVVAIATVLVASVVYTAQDFASAGAVLVATMLSAANLKFMFQGSYFESSPDAQPYLHYWSLSVEEQFYLLFPALLVFILANARGFAVKVLIVIAVLSLCFDAFLAAKNPVWAFYLLPTRAWELLLGSIIAATPPPIRRSVFRFVNPWLQTIGIALVLASVFLIVEGSLFAGLITLIPTAGAAAIILADPDPDSASSRWLSSPPAVAIGKLSYSLYLWHWPVFCFVDYHFYERTSIWRLLIKVGTALALAFSAYYILERPARSALNLRKNKLASFLMFGVMTAVVIPFGLSIRNNNYVNAEVSDLRKGGLKFATQSPGRSVVLMGDSNGSMYGKVVREICEKLNCNLTVLSAAAEDELPPAAETSGGAWLAALSAVQKIRPDCLIVANAWAQKLKLDQTRLAVAIEALEPVSGHILLLNQPPTLPPEANRLAIRNGSHPPYFESPKIREERQIANEYLGQLVYAKTTVVDIANSFELPNKELVFADRGGRFFYHDAGHLSGYGAEHVRGLLEQAMKTCSQ